MRKLPTCKHASLLNISYLYMMMECLTKQIKFDSKYSIVLVYRLNTESVSNIQQLLLFYFQSPRINQFNGNTDYRNNVPFRLKFLFFIVTPFKKFRKYEFIFIKFLLY